MKKIGVLVCIFFGFRHFCAVIFDIVTKHIELGPQDASIILNTPRKCLQDQFNVAEATDSDVEMAALEVK